jgi:hypothetical protein
MSVAFEGRCESHPNNPQESYYLEICSRDVISETIQYSLHKVTACWIQSVTMHRRVCYKDETISTQQIAVGDPEYKRISQVLEENEHYLEVSSNSVVLGPGQIEGVKLKFQAEQQQQQQQQAVLTHQAASIFFNLA